MSVLASLDILLKVTYNEEEVFPKDSVPLLHSRNCVQLS